MAATPRKAHNPLGGLVTAIRTLTILPSPGVEAVRPSDALPWFPLVGLALGALLHAGVLLLNAIARDRWPEGLAAVAVLAGTVLTGGLHLDGLADWADGLGGKGDRRRMLDIMKDSRTGSFAVIAVACAFLIKWISISRLVALHFSVWIAAATAISRCMQADLAARLPYARDTGTAGAFVQPTGAARRAVILATGLSVVVIFFGLGGVALFLVAWLTAWIFGRWCLRRLGGVTGDLLGACSEITETLTLFICALTGETLIPSSQSFFTISP